MIANHHNHGLINPYKAANVSDWCLSPVWEINANFDTTFNKNLFDEIFIFYKNINDGLSKPTDLVNFDAPLFENFKEKILQIMGEQYALFTNTNVSSSTKDLPFEILSTWLNILPPGESIQMHAHPNALISGTYYLSTPENCGDLVLLDTKEVVIDPNNGGTSLIKVAPKEGNLVFFPAYVMHKVCTNNSNGLRISLAFDLQFKDKVTKITTNNIAQVLVSTYENHQAR